MIKASTFAFAAVLTASAAPVLAQDLSPFASGAQMQAAMAAGRTTSQALVKAAQARIQALDHAGPRLNAVIGVFPTADTDAWSLDGERKAGRVRGPLHGLPILLKDNIEAAGVPAHHRRLPDADR